MVIAVSHRYGYEGQAGRQGKDLTMVTLVFCDRFVDVHRWIRPTRRDDCIDSSRIHRVDDIGQIGMRSRMIRKIQKIRAWVSKSFGWRITTRHKLIGRPLFTVIALQGCNRGGINVD